MRELIENYSVKLKEALDNLPVDQIYLAKQWLGYASRPASTIYIAGNGGSAATAEHFACDLLLARCHAVCLTSNMAELTAFSNDFGYGLGIGWILSRSARPGDHFIGISTSGNSKNIVQAAEQAKLAGLFTLGMTGKDGGELAKIVDMTIAVPSDDTQIIEDLHLVIVHMIIRSLNG